MTRKHLLIPIFYVFILSNMAFSQSNLSNGLLEYSAGNYNNALKYYLSDSLNRQNNSKQIAMCYFQLNNLSMAENYFKLANSNDSADYIPYFYLAKIAKMSGRVNNAASYYKEAILKKNNFKEAVYELAILYYDGKKYNEAMGEFEKCLLMDSNDCLANHFYGMSLFQLGEIESSIKWFQKAIRISPAFLPSINSLGGCYFIRKKYDSSIMLFSNSLSIDSTSGSVHKRLADCYYQLDSNDISIKTYKKAIEMGEKNPAIYNSLGWLFRKSGDYDSSIIYYRLYLDDDSTDAKRWYDLAVVYSAARMLDQAMYCYEKTTQLYEKELVRNLPGIYVQHATLLRANKKIEEAIEKIKRSLQLNDKNAYGYYYLGQAYEEIKNNTGAIENYERYLELEEKNEKTERWRYYVEKSIKTLKGKLHTK